MNGCIGCGGFAALLHPYPENYLEVRTDVEGAFGIRANMHHRRIDAVDVDDWRVAEGRAAVAGKAHDVAGAGE